MSKFSRSLSLREPVLNVSHEVQAQPTSRDLTPDELITALLKLVHRVYPNTTPKAAADEVAELIKSEQRALAYAGLPPLDILDVSPRGHARAQRDQTKPQQARSPLMLAHQTWRVLERSRLSKRTLTGGRVRRIVRHLLGSSASGAHLIKELNKLTARARGGADASAGRARLSLGLLEGSYTLGLENIQRGSKLLNSSHKRGERALRETLTLLQDAERYLKRAHTRSGLISGEQLTLIALTQAICHLGLGQTREAKRALVRFFTLPSEGEALVKLGALIKPELKSAQAYAFKQRRSGLKVKVDWVEGFSDLSEVIARWIALTRAPRHRLRELKGGARDLIKRQPQLRTWWKRKAPRLRLTLADAEAQLTLTQLILSAATTTRHQHQRADALSEIEWVMIPRGSLWVPNPKQREEMIEVKILHDFLLAKSEVTVEQYERCVTAGACTPALWERCELWNGKRYYRGPAPPSFREPYHPIVCVDWNQARAFARWVGGDLPSESEWMYSAQSAGRGSTFPWGEVEASCERAVMSGQMGTGCGRHSSWDVCSHELGVTEQGACDLAGNVWEWVLDESPREGSQPIPRLDATARPSCREETCSAPSASRVARGGGWGSDASYLKVTARISFRETRAHLFLGFRPRRPLH